MCHHSRRRRHHILDSLTDRLIIIIIESSFKNKSRLYISVCMPGSKHTHIVNKVAPHSFLSGSRLPIRPTLDSHNRLHLVSFSLHTHTFLSCHSLDPFGSLSDNRVLSFVIVDISERLLHSPIGFTFLTFGAHVEYTGIEWPMFIHRPDIYKHKPDDEVFFPFGNTIFATRYMELSRPMWPHFTNTLSSWFNSTIYSLNVR